MILSEKSRWVKATAWYLCVQMLVSPIMGYAYSGDPVAPEFSEFTPYAASEMVDPFSGDFSTNIPVLEVPGPHGSGYPLSLSYQSGLGPESETSWVGFGWALNPGAITRNKRNLPDDYRGDSVTYFNKHRPHRTASVGVVTTGEIYSFDFPALEGTVIYNSQRGFSTRKGITFEAFNGISSLNLGLENGQPSATMDVNPARALDFSRFRRLIGPLHDPHNQMSKADQNVYKQASSFMKGMSSASSLYSRDLASRGEVKSSFVSGYTGGTLNFGFTIQGNVSPLHLGIEGGIRGTIAEQVSIPVENMSAFGQMYHAEGEGGEKRVMDFHYENDEGYSTRDNFIPAALNDYDNFRVSGEGIGGDFRLFHRTLGELTPNQRLNFTTSADLSGDVGLGLNISGGGNIGSGFHTMTVGGWETDGQADYQAPGETDEAVFFRFRGDMAGEVSYQDHDGLVAPSISVNGVRGTKKGHYDLGSAFPDEITSVNPTTQRVDRSSYIGYHTNAEIAGRPEEAYEQDLKVYLQARRNAPEVANRIGEFQITNATGQAYTYGLPVYSVLEHDLQFGVSPDDVQNETRAYKTVSLFEFDKQSEVTGQVMTAPYAHSYLLTSVVTPDYQDRTNDGLTEDDFGGWTKFNYDRSYGDSNDFPAEADDADAWYKYRAPYHGLAYDPGSSSDPQDDKGSVMYGFTEKYVLSTIETKTHIAYFVTNNSSFTLPNNEILAGSGEERLDALQASHQEIQASDSYAQDQAYNKAPMLERIVLISKDDPTCTPLNTVFFEYDYELVPDTENSKAPNGARLTLKRVWNESNGTLSPKISPYEFEYTYPVASDYAPEVQNRYPDVVAYGDQWTAAQQNPAYSNVATDRWGMYRADGQQRSLARNPYVDQTPDAGFDPAAYHLKVIHLPSGGQVQVHYEQDDYAYVQNKNATAMVSMAAMQSNPTSEVLTVDVVGELGLDPAKLNVYAAQAYEYFVLRSNPLYFKMLYALLGNVEPFSIGCNSEYIEAYAQVTNVQAVNGKLRIDLADPTFPRTMCKDFYRDNRQGMIDPDGDCSQSIKMDGETAKSIAFAILAGYAPLDAQMSNFCLNRNVDLSYLRLPVFDAKQGGGVRVARLMMYDEGMEAGDATLVGSQYQYTYQDLPGVSSGVASNEPRTGWDENALVELNPNFRDASPWWQNLGTNKDREQISGPFLPGILPGAAVGYAEVTVSNLHDGKTSPGYMRTKYFTTKDTPTYGQNIGGEWSVDHTPLKIGEDNLIIPIPFFTRQVNRQWRAQGYRVIHYNLSGRTKEKASYAGSPTDPEAADHLPTSLEVYNYQDPRTPVPMYHDWGDTRLEYPGREMDIAFAHRRIDEKSMSHSVQLDGGLGMFAAIPVGFGSGFPRVSISESTMAEAVVTKQIWYTPILESVTKTIDGIETVIRNEAFDPHTGHAVVVRTEDGHDGLTLPEGVHRGIYRSYSFMAASQYPGMGMKAHNEGLVLRTGDEVQGCTMDLYVTQTNGRYFLTFSAANCSDPESAVCAMEAKLGAGDLVRVVDNGTDKLYYLGEPEGEGFEVFPAAEYNETLPIASVGDVTLRVVRSGRTNELKALAGSLTTYGGNDEPTLITLPADPKILSARHEMAKQLTQANENLAGVGATQMVNAWEDNLQFVNDQGDCALAKGSLSITLKRGQTYDVRCEGDTPNGVNAYLITLPAGVVIEYDEESGMLGYRYPGSCSLSPLGCINLCPDAFSGNSLAQVLSASANTYSDAWSQYTNEYPEYTGQSSSEAPYETGARGRWRVASAWAYNTEDVVSANGPGGRTYKSAGVMNTFSLFNWQVPQANDPEHWIEVETVESYHPDGQPVTSRNAIAVPSGKRYGYNMQLPVATAVNAEAGQFAYYSFEDQEVGDIEYPNGQNMGMAQVMDGPAHSGTQALLTLGQDDRELIGPTLGLDASGMLAKLWVHHGDDAPGTIELRVNEDAENNLAPDRVALLAPVMRTGEWVLYSGSIPNLTEVTDRPSLVFKGWTGIVYVDDVAFQPIDSEMNAYVFDPRNLRLLTQFGPQHLGSFYQYTGAGKLVRIQVETELGLRTLKEQQYHSRTVDRSNP